MKIESVSFTSQLPPLPGGTSPGIYPYLGGKVAVDQLQSIVDNCGTAVVSGRKGAKLARQVSGVLLDPAQYEPSAEDDPGALFEYESWLKRQQAAEVPIYLTDTPRIQNGDRSALQDALKRWEFLEEPTLMVLPIEPWWLKDGRTWLIQEVRKAKKPVAVVLLAAYNGLDASEAVSGLLSFIEKVSPVPVVMLRCDISAVGAVAHGASAGFIGWSPSTRHGSKPIRSTGGEDRKQDKTPGVFVPALHDYFKASRFPALARFRHADVLRCYDHCCGRVGLHEIADLSETNQRAARTKAYQHSVISADLVAEHVLSADEPRDSWWEACKAGAFLTEELIEAGINVSLSDWLRQWVALGSPAHAPEIVG